MPAPVTLTRDPDIEGTHRWPSGRRAVVRWGGDDYAAHLDRAGFAAATMIRDGDGRRRTFPSPTLAASALGARLPAE